MAKSEHTEHKMSALMTSERIEVIRQAIVENYTWLRLVQERCEDETEFHILAPTIFARMDVLSSIILSGVDDEHVDAVELASMLEPATIE